MLRLMKRARGKNSDKVGPKAKAPRLKGYIYLAKDTIVIEKNIRLTADIYAII